MKNPKMTKVLEELYLADADKWDSGELGRDDAHVKVAGPENLNLLHETLNIESVEEFFSRGKAIAKLADKKLSHNI